MKKAFVFGRWTIYEDGDWLIVENRSGEKYRLWRRSNGWIDFEHPVPKASGTLMPGELWVRTPDKKFASISWCVPDKLLVEHDADLKVKLVKLEKDDGGD